MYVCIRALLEKPVDSSHEPSIALRSHRDVVCGIAEPHRAGNTRVFSSVIHGDDMDDSDLDLMVDPTPDTTLMDMAAIQVE